MHLKHLLKSFGYTTPVAYSPKIVNSLVESPKNLGKAAEQERRLRLFMKLFCARQDVYAERWETYFWCFDDSFGYFCHIRLQSCNEDLLESINVQQFSLNRIIFLKKLRKIVTNDTIKEK